MSGLSGFRVGDGRRPTTGLLIIGHLPCDLSHDWRKPGQFTRFLVESGEGGQIDFEVEDRFLADGDDSGSQNLDNTSPMLGIVARSGPCTPSPLSCTSADR